MLSILTQRFSADHQSRVEVRFQSEVFEYIYDDMKNAGCTFYVKQPELRSRLGLEPIDFRSYDETRAFERGAKAAELAALRAGDPIVWIVFGEHSGCWVDFRGTSAHPPRFSDSWLTGFVIVRRDVWNACWCGKRPCTQTTVMRFLQAWRPYVSADLNGSLCEWRYVDETNGEDYWSDGYLDMEEALEEALSRHPECRYEEGDFDEIVQYRLKRA